MDFKPGTFLVYMTASSHAEKSLEEIFCQKLREIKAVGHTFWGYGGTVCDPKTQVQELARLAGGKLDVVMPLSSGTGGDGSGMRTKYSVDGKTDWQPIDPRITCTGSKWALVINNLKFVDEQLDLAKTRVAVGETSRDSRRGNGADYADRTGKACLEVAAGSDRASLIKHIAFRARLVEPFAVYLH
jgi:hypothetical protein